MRLPIIYVRGYAGSTSGIDKAVDDPFYGFNEGSVHVRVGLQPDPVFYQFESPLLRLLMEPHDHPDDVYHLLVQGGQEKYLDSRSNGSVDPMTVWVHRFYDRAASGWGGRPEAFSLEGAAASLFVLVKKVLAATGAPRVHLVAHSMGGLICRSMIQRVIPDDPTSDRVAADYVQSLFTYGTPHGGIEFAVGHGLLEKVRDAVDVNGASIFGADRMYRYLTPESRRRPERPEGWAPTTMTEQEFPLDRVFCLVGTNPEDYAVALGLSSAAVGARSDGLVQIENAYVPGAHRAFVHRSHSGRLGMVNSEEGYQNLKRFLFGDLEVEVRLLGLDQPEPKDDTVWQLETQLSIRGLPIVMHEQTTAHHCPVQIEWPPTGADRADRPEPLITTFLSSRQAALNRAETGRDSGPLRLRHALRLRLISLEEHDGVFGFGDHLEQVEEWLDTVIVEIEPATGPGQHPQAWAIWNTQLPRAVRTWLPTDDEVVHDSDVTDGVWRGVVQLPPSGKAFLGDEARLEFTVTGRGAAPAAVAAASGAAPVGAPPADEAPPPREKTRWRWLR